MPEPSASLTIEVGAASRGKGTPNEDAYLTDATHLVFGVFDGLGSTTDASAAARLASSAIGAAYRHRASGDCAGEMAYLSLAVRGAGALIAAALADGLTTASVVALCRAEEGVAKAVICNVGDSRVYRYTNAGTFHQCTLDDSVLASDWDLQLHLSEVTEPSGSLEAAYFLLRHVMDSALGDRVALPHTWDVPAEDGDVLLAVTDGVSDNLTFSELAGLLGDRPSGMGELAERIVVAAHTRSRDPIHARAKVDDITAVAARVRYTDPTNGCQ